MLAWAFEITPDGVVRSQVTPPGEGAPAGGAPPPAGSGSLAGEPRPHTEGEPETSPLSRTAAIGITILAIGAVVLIFFGKPFFAPHDGRDQYLDSARVHVDRALALDPELPEALLRRAEDIIRTGDHAAALPVLLRALELNPGHPRVLLALAETQLQLGGYVEALEYARRGAGVDRTAGIHHAVQGATLARVGAFEDAVRAFRTADSVTADMPWTGMPPPLRAVYVRASRAAGREAEAEAMYDEIRETVYRLDQPRAWELLADLELELGRVDAAREHYERQRAGLPENHDDVFTGLALIYRERGRAREAEALLREAEEAARRWLTEGGSARSHAHFTLARVHAIRGDADAAVRALEAAAAAGWDGYHAARLDPRLAGLEGHPGYEAVLERVRSGLDRARLRLIARVRN